LAVSVVVLTVIVSVLGDPPGVLGLVPGSGVAFAVVSLLQLSVAMAIEHRYDKGANLAFVLGPIYPAAYWLLNAAASITSQVPAMVRGPRATRVTWDLSREPQGERSAEAAATDARVSDEFREPRS
jgi:hypothetical protein